MPNTNTPHNFSYLGNLTASATTPVPGFFVSTPPGSQSFLSRLWGQILGGTSVAVQVRRNAYPAYSGAVPITGWNTVTITTTPGGFVLPELRLSHSPTSLSSLKASRRQAVRARKWTRIHIFANP